MERAYKIWGTRDRLFHGKQTTLDLLNLNKNSFCSVHYHKRKYNKFYVITGNILIRFGHKEIILKSGLEFSILPNQIHQFVVLDYSTVIELSWVDEGLIEEEDIVRFKQGGKIIDGIEISEDNLKDNDK